MGCVAGGRKITINTDRQIEMNYKISNSQITIKKQVKNIGRKRSTLKEILKLAEISKGMKLKNFATLINAKPEDNYIIMNKLGKGSFGSVYKVRHKTTGKIRAMKIINNENIIEQGQILNHDFLKEIEVLKELEHPNIIKIIEYYIDNKNHYIITELINGGELFDSIIKFKKFNEKKAAYIMKQILSALNYLHSKGIVHRDIKPENILIQKLNGKKDKKDDINSFQVKLIDFGSSNYFKDHKKLTLRVGSPYYIAPEVLNKNYDEKCDIWSSGVVLYIMLTGNFPFMGNNSHKLCENIKTGKYKKSGKEYKSISKEGKKLIEQMLTLNPKKRLNASQCLNSPFFTKFNNESFNEVSDLLPSVLSNIYKLNAREKLQQSAIAIIVHNIENEEFLHLKEIFDLLDINNDGHLTINEIKQAFKKIFPENYITEEKMKLILEKMDDNKDGAISYEEFLRMTISEKILLEKKNLKLAFDTFDVNKDGQLSKEELINALGTGTSDYVNSLLDLIDKNKDGFISFEEFCHLMNKINKDLE